MGQPNTPVIPNLGEKRIFFFILADVACCWHNAPMTESSNSHHQICDLCGGDKFELISERDRKGKHLKTGLCLGCGLVMHLPVPDEADIQAYYATQYRRDYHGERKPSARRIMRAWNNGQRILHQLQPHIPAGADVFEIGAGIGCNTKSFAEAGFKASAIEPNEDFNQYTRNVLHADVENVNLYDLESSASHDVVMLIHVIEHFVSPRRALTTIRGLLKDEGLLYIECPNVTGPFATFDRMFHYAHIYNFSPETLIAMANACGFELMHSFKDANHPDIEMLFRKTEMPEQFQADASIAEQVRRDITEHNSVSYHMRPDYLSRRFTKVRAYAKEFSQARKFVAELEARFNKS